ncbi:MAG TPA: hypothetical protein VNZ53_42370 [Steroidobacteraceae bacterium]|jgi:hypothetical protein|nr:hypothetical protein [Steroidobacteraceae bacterium]
MDLVRPVAPREDETATVEIAANKDEQILPGGPNFAPGSNAVRSSAASVALLRLSAAIMATGCPK